MFINKNTGKSNLAERATLDPWQYKTKYKVLKNRNTATEQKWRTEPASIPSPSSWEPDCWKPESEAGHYHP